MNEAANLRFLATHDGVPIPSIICEYEDDGAFVIVMTRAKGMRIDELCGDCKEVTRKNVKELAERLHRLKSYRLGGASEQICPPHQVMKRFSPEQCHWTLQEANEPEYVFCHNDLRESNNFIDPETLK
jgi:aminoglycoside phosphotransferase